MSFLPLTIAVLYGDHVGNLIYSVCNVFRISQHRSYWSCPSPIQPLPPLTPSNGGPLRNIEMWKFWSSLDLLLLLPIISWYKMIYLHVHTKLCILPSSAHTTYMSCVLLGGCMLTLSYSLVDDSTYDGWSDKEILGKTPRKRFSVFRDTLHTLVIFQTSINNPIKQLMMMTKLVSLSRM